MATTPEFQYYRVRHAQTNRWFEVFAPTAARASTTAKIHLYLLLHLNRDEDGPA